MHIAQTNNSMALRNKKQNVILIHGLFRSLSNWDLVKSELSSLYNIYTPELPIYKQNTSISPLRELVDFLKNYITIHQIKDPILVGNSLGGHVALLYTLRYQYNVAGLVLTGSSGLYDSSINNQFTIINDYTYIKSKITEVFYRTEVVEEKLINNILTDIQDKKNLLSIISLTKDAKRQSLKDELHTIKIPIQLIWGMQDNITPISVAEEFYLSFPSVRLSLINECGHVPMMEQPVAFNNIVYEFINAKIINVTQHSNTA